MKDIQIIGRGAEAVIYRRDDVVIKERPRKSYRIREIDDELRKFRTKREVKIMKKLSALGFRTAKLFSENYDKNSYEMEFLNGEKLRDILSKKNYKEFCRQIGEMIAFLHNRGIMHNDLTTSNMIVIRRKIYLIDFGLSFYSDRIEDMAVDLHLLRQALESRHQEIWREAFFKVIDAYRKNYKNADAVLKRFGVVEMRGRYKKKGEGRERGGIVK